MFYKLGNLGDDTTGTTDTSGATTDTSGSGNWLSNLITGFTQYKLSQQQADRVNQLNQINIQRAAAGLSPLNVDLVGPSVSVGLSPSTKNLLVYGGLGLGALMLLKTVMGRR